MSYKTQLLCDFTGMTSLAAKMPKLGDKDIDRLSRQVLDWTDSDFAGFRRVLDEDSVEATSCHTVRNAVERHQKGSTSKRISTLVVLGTGGSSLGTETIIRALHSAAAHPRVMVYDNNDPDFFADALKQWHPEETSFYVVSKSGSTPETLSQFMVAREWLLKGLPKGGDWKQHVVLCTDPERGDLRELAKREKLTCLDVPSAVGGRFSVLTAVGMFPAAFAGLPIEQMLAGARGLAEFLEEGGLAKDHAFAMARMLVADPKKNITVLMPYSSRLQAFGRWFAQLWGESLGKEGKGFTPYPAIGTVDQHSQVQLYMEGPRDKVIGLIQVEKAAQELPLKSWDAAKDLPSFKELDGLSMHKLFDAEFRATRDALIGAGVPVFVIRIKQLNAESLGELFYWWQLVTAYAGALMGINPFDQPGVEQGKKLTKQYLKKIL